MHGRRRCLPPLLPRRHTPVRHAPAAPSSEHQWRAKAPANANAVSQVPWQCARALRKRAGPCVVPTLVARTHGGWVGRRKRQGHERTNGSPEAAAWFVTRIYKTLYTCPPNPTQPNPFDAAMCHASRVTRHISRGLFRFGRGVGHVGSRALVDDRWGILGLLGSGVRRGVGEWKGVGVVGEWAREGGE